MKKMGEIDDWPGDEVVVGKYGAEQLKTINKTFAKISKGWSKILANVTPLSNPAE